MNCYAVHKFKTLSVVALFVAIVSILATLSSLAQVRDVSRTSAESSLVSAPAQVSRSPQALAQQLLPGTVSEQGIPARRPRKRSTNSAAADSGSVGFLPAVTYDAGGGVAAPPGSLAVADVNGDGKPDIIVANSPVGGGVSAVGVLLGNGDGTFQPVILNTSVGQVGEFNALAVADVNEDGKLDLVVVSCCESNDDAEAAVLLGNGDGTFQSAVTYDGGGHQLSSLVVGDVNGDGRPDIVMVNWNGSNNSTANVLLGNGDGTFQPALSSAAPDDPSCAAMADVNHDGKPDLLICSEDSVAVLLGNGDGTFQSFANTNFYSGFCDSAALVADVNADGLPDMVVPNAGGDGCGSEGFAGILLGNGDGTFQTEVNYLALNDTNIGVGSAAISDLNGDGKPDVMVTTGLALYGSVHGSVGVLLGNGDGTFQTATSFDAGGSQTDAVVAADLNGDGKPDIVVANFGSATIGVLLNSGTNSGNSTTTTLVSSQNPSELQSPVTFTAVVSAAVGTPTGTVTFSDYKNVIGSGTLSNGSAALTTSSLSRGLHSITAAYQGSEAFEPSKSAALDQKVIIGKFSTEIRLSTSRNPAFVGQPVTFTASVTSPAGMIPNGEMVDFFREGYIGSAPLNNGVASLTTSSLSAGAWLVSALYPGDDMFRAVGTRISQLIERYPTKTMLVSSLNPAVYGQSVTYTVTVTSSGPDVPTGTVRLTDIGLVPLVGGVATFTKTRVREGIHAIEASYTGDGASARSTSPAVEEVVKPAPTTAAIISSANPSSSGESVTFTATVTSSTGVNTYGKVTFTSGTTTLGIATLHDNQASVSTAALPVGSNTITVTYKGTPSFTGSSASLMQVVQP